MWFNLFIESLRERYSRIKITKEELTYITINIKDFEICLFKNNKGLVSILSHYEDWCVDFKLKDEKEFIRLLEQLRIIKELNIN